MSPALNVLLLLAGLFAGSALLARLRTPGVASPDLGSAVISIVVPARQEAGNLPTLLRSLAALDPAPAEVIVVDDESTDGTAEVARAHGARVLGAPPRPVGWLGKPWACHIGADAATGNLLLFLDADTSLAPDALTRLLAERNEHGGLISVQPYHRAVGTIEELSAMPNLVTMMGTGAFTAWRSAVPRAAFGPCLLTSVADYETVGGHATVKGRVVEDLHLARAYRDNDLPVTCMAGGETVRFRMYPDGLGQLMEGWSKNLASGAGSANRIAVFGAVAWVMALVAIATRGIGDLADLATGQPLHSPWTDAGLWATAAIQLRMMLRQVGSFRTWTALLFPIPVAAFVLLFLRSLLLTTVRRQVTWRGRHISVASTTPDP